MPESIDQIILQLKATNDVETRLRMALAYIYDVSTRFMDTKDKLEAIRRISTVGQIGKGAM